MRIGRDESIVMTACDGSLFVCYKENVGGRGNRWVYVSAERMRYDGGVYAGENAIEAIRARFNEWWALKSVPYVRTRPVED